MSAKDNRLMPLVKPEEVGVSSVRLARIRPAMQRYIDQQKIPNIVTLIVREGKIVHLEAQGYLDLDSRKPATADAIFRLYSNSKPITGAAIMILYEEGLLELDDPVSRYIPAFKDPLVLAPPGAARGTPGPGFQVPLAPARREINIRDCLRNTTGLATPMRTPASVASQYAMEIAESGWNLIESLDTPPKKSYLERVEAHARIPLNFEPGTDFVYHAGYPVLGVLIEKITGQPLDRFYRERIFEPLGMKDTSFYLDAANARRFSSCYRPSKKSGKWEMAIYDKAETSEKITGPRVCFGPGGDMGGVLSTIGDYARFAQMLLNNGELDGVRILGRKSVELMTSNHTGDILIPMIGPGFGFGLGVGVYRGGSPRPVMRSPGTFGWGGAAGTSFFADPKEKLTAICFTQMFNHVMMPENTYQEDFEKLVYQALI
jgi:CubicO group peptidase (beta-lactamase class C family)